ncbi:hypothetical protein M595_0352 [Lyngbya aestuarii BL J]|uniref:DUF4349 domain-containing protein n=1 Tax=Lyngbya aestuarii BL J TaxID=1348334 RepID=U7QTI9_9CYAN|nr:DUF4349 domain-containing protein [Lyngbya aestuarii]ERT09746.1 hypothetical protein M595_0352 [Lyngbya aestuarii BL J]
MNNDNHKIRFLWAFLSIFALTSCASAPSSFSEEMTSSPQLEQAVPQSVAGSPPSSPDSIPQQKPQLIKRAELTLVVQSLDETLSSVTVLVQRQQGDILRFADYQPQNNSSRHTANLELRVPQAKLESTLDALIQLGTVENRLITTEDVSNQLVDTQARLRNLRKSEEMILKIMERSGSVGEVLQVANELSNIRESIERLDAQLRNLQNQVAYSTITLNLEVAVSASSPSQSNFGLQVGETWGKATHAVTELTFGLFGVVVWLLAFSPYFILLGGAVYGYRRWRKNINKNVG